MGFALARAARRRGAEVILVTGPTALPFPPRPKAVPVRTAAEMCEAVLMNLESSSTLIMAAAVSDYRPKQTSSAKMKKTGKELLLPLEPTSDILYEVGRQKGQRLLVGFAAETRTFCRMPSASSWKRVGPDRG